MKNQPDTPVHKTNRLAYASLVVGIISLLPFLPFLITILFIGRRSTFIDALSAILYEYGLLIIIICIVFGLISILIGVEALEQIRRGSNAETGYGIAVTGRVFGIFGVITNVIFSFLFLMQ